jgi:ribosomal protein L34E
MRRERVPGDRRRCAWCGRPFDANVRGRPRRYCRHSCRQAAHVARRFAAQHGLGDDDVVVSRAVLEDLQSRLYCLRAALEDVERDLARSSEPQDVAEALDWLVENVRPLVEVWVEPRAVEPGVG